VDFLVREKGFSEERVRTGAARLSKGLKTKQQGIPPFVCVVCFVCGTDLWSQAHRLPFEKGIPCISPRYHLPTISALNPVKNLRPLILHSY
jgi:hypothetical protein